MRCPFKMTTNKYTPFDSKLENLLKGIDSRIQEVRGIATGVYDQLSELAKTVDAVHKTVSCHPTNSGYSPDEDWDFLDGED